MTLVLNRSQESLERERAAQRADLAEKVNAERDRRIAENFRFGGHGFDLDPASKQNITGAGSLAGFAVAQGAAPGDLRWNGGSEDFAWISSANVPVTMDAQTVFAFAAAAAEHVRAHVFAARLIKDAAEPPADFASDAYWPALQP